MTDPSATPPGLQPPEDASRATELPPSADMPGPEPGPEGTPTTVPAASMMPEYKGEPLDAERGPGLGCFWIQIVLLTFFLIFTPLTVTWGWDPLVSGILLIITLVLLLFSGQTIIFLLRLVAADRRARRTPLSPSAKPTVGQMEDAGPQRAESTPAATPADEAPADDGPADEARTDDGRTDDGRAAGSADDGRPADG